MSRDVPYGQRKHCRWCNGGHVDLLDHEARCVMRPEAREAAREPVPRHLDTQSDWMDNDD